MDRTTETYFEELSRRTLDEIDTFGRKLSKQDYVEGLDVLISDLESARNATQEELDNESVDAEQA